jgi:uncharacterized membrane protein
MKKLNLVYGLLIAGFAFASVACAGMIPIRGNGDLVASERNVSSFEKIEAHGEVEVRYFVSEEQRVVVTADLNLDEYTKVYTNGSVLIITTEHGNYQFTKYLVEVYSPSLSGISVSGSGQFSSDEIIASSTFNTHVSGSGKISGTIQCEKLTSKISGSGTIILAGSSSDANIDISGSGNFVGSELQINDTSVEISGSGEATINVAENLKAKISGSGDLYYRGNPTIDFEMSGSGSFQQM